MRPRPLLVVLAAAALQLAVLAGVWPGFLSPNEWSRLAAARALVMDGTWSVDRQVREWGATEDIAAHGGRLYSDKAPGTVWLAVPVVWAVHAVRPEAPPALDTYWVRLVTVSLPALLAALLLARWLAARGLPETEAAAAAAALVFATNYGTYAGVAFAHATAGALLLAGAWILLGPPGERAGSPIEAVPRAVPPPALARSAPAAAAAGLALSLAAACEYHAALPAAAVALAAVPGRWRRLPWLALGAAVPALSLGAYNAACFGTPWTLPYRHYASRWAEVAAAPLGGFGPPRLAALAGLTVGSWGGLLFLAPFLLPAVAAPVTLWRRGDRRLAAAVGAAVWLVPVVMAGYGPWQGGASFGPRYLVSTVPFWVLGAFLAAPPTRLAAGLGALGAALAVHLAARLTPPFAIDAGPWASTLRAWTVPCLLEGRWNPPAPWLPLPPTAALGLAAAAWLAAAAVVWRARPPHLSRLAAAAALAGILAVQIGAGSVTTRQHRWLERSRRWFAVPAAWRPSPAPAAAPPASSPGPASAALPAVPSAHAPGGPPTPQA